MFYRKKFIATLLTFFSLYTLLGRPDVSLKTQVSVESEYVFRASRQASQSLQPSIQLSHPTGEGQLYTGLWNNLPIRSQNTPYCNEVDPYVGYRYPIFRHVALDGGGIYYWHPSPKPGVLGYTQEAYLGLNCDFILRPSVYGYYDFRRQQWTLESSLGYDFDLTELGLPQTSIELLGYMGVLRARNAYRGMQAHRQKNGYWYFGSSLNLVYQFNKHSGVKLGMRYAHNRDGKTGPANRYGKHTHLFWVGLSTFLYF